MKKINLILKLIKATLMTIAIAMNRNIMRKRTLSDKKNSLPNKKSKKNVNKNPIKLYNYLKIIKFFLFSVV